MSGLNKYRKEGKNVSEREKGNWKERVLCQSGGGGGGNGNTVATAIAQIATPEESESEQGHLIPLIAKRTIYSAVVVVVVVRCCVFAQRHHNQCKREMEWRKSERD